VALALVSLYSIKTVIFACAVMSRPAPSAKILFSLILIDIVSKPNRIPTDQQLIRARGIQICSEYLKIEIEKTLILACS
jgi:hypothetical protein